MLHMAYGFTLRMLHGHGPTGCIDVIYARPYEMLGVPPCVFVTRELSRARPCSIIRAYWCLVVVLSMVA
ncbi:hypothetical protein PanWU01x14_023040 [Parasponia andersonii]|uniref:Uncharacterized protein n=1 Tax=Parasponia andersonii TaxID=3476 RepID=A0A2P5DXE9_PARAD|nr:hypothetical protein PanWU01x14_023040 [Parasponia andersonii]